MRVFLCLGVVSLLVFVAAEGASAWPIVQLTDNDFDDTMPQVSGNNVAWTGGSESEIDVFFYDGAVHKLTDGSFLNNGSICLDGNRVAWTGWNAGGSSEVFLFDGQTTRQITDNNVNDDSPALWSGGLAWLKDDDADYEVFLYDGASTVQLTDDVYNQYSLDASGKYVGWVTNDGSVCHVMRYDGHMVSQLTENPVDVLNSPITEILLSEENVLFTFLISKSTESLVLCTTDDRNEIARGVFASSTVDISGSRVVWASGHAKLFLYEENQIIQITRNDNDDCCPCVSSSLVAWEGDDGSDKEIFIYDGNTIMQVTDNDFDDMYPCISESTLTWQHWDGNDWEIQMISISEPSCEYFVLLGLICFGMWRARGSF